MCPWLPAQSIANCCGDDLTTVGYPLGRQPGAHEHLKRIRQKFGARAGIIRHLKKIGIETGVLTKIYTSLVRPVFEYAAVCSNAGLTEEQSEALERLQRISLKNIFGLSTSYETCLQLSGLERLDTRRKNLFRNFVKKSYESDRFRGKWYQSHRSSGYGLRTERRVEQKFALRDRLVNAPLYQARRLINSGELL